MVSLQTIVTVGDRMRERVVVQPWRDSKRAEADHFCRIATRDRVFLPAILDLPPLQHQTTANKGQEFGVLKGRPSWTTRDSLRVVKLDQQANNIEFCTVRAPSHVRALLQILTSAAIRQVSMKKGEILFL
jgi:hypothetical protein